MSVVASIFQPVVNRLWFAMNKPSRHYAPNPHLQQKRSFYGGDVDRLLNGWTTNSAQLDVYLRAELTSLRARSREACRQSPFAKRYLSLLKTNIIGEAGFKLDVHVPKRNGELDDKANDAIEKAYELWSSGECDYSGNMSFPEMQRLAIATVAQDGEAIFRIYEGNQYGKFGFRIQQIDSEELDITRNETLKNGNVIRLGVEYNSYKRPVRYYFHEPDEYGNYTGGRHYSLDARQVIHLYRREGTNQSRGIPWTSSGLEELKHLSKYDEAAMVAARYGAAKMAFITSTSDAEEDEFKGDALDQNGNKIEHIEPGMIANLGNRTMGTFDPKYPHEMYVPFIKAKVRKLAVAWDISYAALAADLVDVNYSSIRTGSIEERDKYKSDQKWMMTEFVIQIFQRWFTMAYLKEAITFDSGLPLRQPLDHYLDHFKFVGRRWEWVDPQKDMNANVQAIEANVKTRSEIIRESGRDPKKVFAEAKAEKELLESYGLTVATTVVENETDEDDENAKTKD